MAIRPVRKIRSIEGLRGGLALWVLLSHVLSAAGLGEAWRGPFNVIVRGTYAVDTFIIISGFVIFYLLDTANETYGRFLWRRMLRLYPVYLVCLIFYTLMLHRTIGAYDHVPWSDRLDVNNILVAESSLTYLPQHLAAHLFMAQSVIPSAMLPFSNYAIIPPAWSLSLEWQFYVLAPLVFAAFAKGPRATIAVIAIACAINFLIAGEEGFLPRHLPDFALGITSYYLWRLPWRPKSSLLLPLVTALAYLLTHNAGVVVWCAVFVAAYEPDSIGSKILRRTLEAPLASFLGRLSYSLYLSHEAVLTLCLLALEQLHPGVIGQWPFFLVLLGLTLSATLAVSWLLTRYVEAPFIAFGGRKGRGPAGSPSIVEATLLLPGPPKIPNPSNTL